MKKLLLGLGLIAMMVLDAFSETILCPLKADPPPAIDGSLAEWYQSPAGFQLKEENITYGKEKWQGPSDLSSTLWLYWDKNYLYLAADVTDDVFIQEQTGGNIWKEDHLELDFDPKYKPGANGIFTEQQFVMGFSPGNLKNTGDPLFDLPPEAYIWKPQGIDFSVIGVASQKTENGYTLEARVPWSLFGIKVKQGDVFGIDFRVSDSDNPNIQETMTSLFPQKWVGRRLERLIPIKLGDTEGR